jgi:hypothetical protein
MMDGPMSGGLMIYAFERSGRSGGAIVTICVIWAVLLGLWVVLTVAWWIIAILLAFTLPALWDAVRDTRARVEVWPKRLVWSATFSDGDATDIDHICMNRRFDGSVKIMLVHVGGATTRLPPDIAPPIAALEAALADAGIRAQRNPFSPI